MKLRGRKKVVAPVCRVTPIRRLSRRMMPEAPGGMEGSENTKPLVATCNLPNITKEKMTSPDLQTLVPKLVDCQAKAQSWEKTKHPDWWPTTAPLTNRSDYTHPIQRKELQEKVNLQVNGVNRTPAQFKDAEKQVVQLYICFFCEKDFPDKDMLQTHQKICSQRPARLLQDLCTPNKLNPTQTRPRVNITNPRKNMYITSLGLLPVEKAKHVEMAHRIRRDSQIDCDSIEVDKTPVMTPRTPTTPRTPKSLISFNTPSANKQLEVCTVSSDDESDSGSTDSLMEPQDYICHAPLMTIDFSSPLGQRIKGHVKQVMKPNTNEYEKFCRTPVKNRFKERLRERDSFASITFKHKRHFRKYYHTYRFTKDDNRDFMLHLETGLNKRSRKLLKHMKPCSVILKRLPKDACEVYKKSKVPNICLEQLTPEQIDRWTRRTPSPVSDPDDLPDLSCTFPPTPVIKCYDLKSLLGATPSRLAVIDKDSDQVDEHTRNRVIVYKAILADVMQDTESVSGTSKLNGQYPVTKGLLRPGNPNPLPTTQQARTKLSVEGLDDDCVFSHRREMEGQPKNKPQPKKAEYVPKFLTSLSPDNPAAGNTTYRTGNAQQSRAILPNQQVSGFSSSTHQSQPRQMGVTVSHVRNYQSNAIPPQRQTGLTNNIQRPQSNIGNMNRYSAQLTTNNRDVRRSGRTRVIEDKIDDEISILVPVGEDGRPANISHGLKRPLVTSNTSGPSSKVPRLDPGRQNVNVVQPSQVVKRLTFENPGANQSKPLASIPPTRSTLNNVAKQPAWNPSINLGTRQAHNINLANAKPRTDLSNNMATRRSTNTSVSQTPLNTSNLPKLGVHENGKTEDKNFLFKCHLCGLEEQYSVNATNKIYNHLHTVHKEEVIHIVDYNTQGEVHLVEAMGQPPTMIRTSNFTKTNPIDAGSRSTPNPPAYYGISTEPTLGQSVPRSNSISSVPSVEGAWFDTLKNKPYNSVPPNARNVPQTRGKMSPQYSLRPKSPPKSYGQPTPPTTPQGCQSVLPRRSTARTNFVGTKSNNSRSIIIDDDDVVCLDDDVICIS